MRLPNWVRLPSGWIFEGGLRSFRWKSNGSSNVAALMTLAALSHRANQDTGLIVASYDDLCAATDLSRAKVSAGLDVLEAREIVQRRVDGRSSYKLANFDPTRGWAMFPARGLYGGEAIAAFRNFKLRQLAELEALKLYYLFAARRDRRTNLAHLTYDQIEEHSGVPRNSIPRALTLLAANTLIHIDRVPSVVSEYGLSSSYRLTHINPHRHRGTIGRSQEPASNFGMDFDD